VFHLKILITGGAGYIGSHTVRVLNENGETPVVLDNLSTGHRELVKDSELVIGDVRDTELVKNTIKKRQIEAVIHFAANSLVGESMSKPAKYLRDNLDMTISVLEAMAGTNCQIIVVSSSAAVYGTPERIPITEDDILSPTNPYGQSKLFMEQAIEWYERLYGFRAARLRYFNAAGAHPDGDLKEMHNPETHLIPLVIRAAINPEFTLSVFGTDYLTPDGTCIRDYIHVCDLASAHLMAIRALERDKKGFVCNLGIGQGYSVRQVINAIEMTIGRKVKYRECDRRIGDPPVLVACATRAKQLMGWEANYKYLRQIVDFV
jgi:UDP-glucose 4-epimerase